MERHFERAIENAKEKLWKECKTCKENIRTGRLLDEFSAECPNNCYIKIKNYFSYASSNIPVEFWDLSLKAYKRDPRVLEVVDDYIKNIKENYEKGFGLVIYGGFGTGKSLLANEILKHACRRDFRCMTKPINEVFEALKPGYKEDTITGTEEEISKMDFYCFEDTGLEYRKKESEFVPRQFDRLFQTRKRARLPTIITLPYSLEQFEINYGGHLASTFRDCMKPLRLSGGDYRKENTRAFS